MEQFIKEISMEEFPSVRIGHVENYEGKTGVSVILFEEGAISGVDISGGGPASRETPLLDPKMACENIHALVLSGGSAYGLEASSGVMKYLEERGIGFETGYAKVPLVCQSCIFDLSYGSSAIRPNAKMGYQACINAYVGNNQMGNIGAGCGATVGKLTTMHRAMKSGLGLYVCQVGDVKVAAIVVVNALGDVFDYQTGDKIAGMKNQERTAYADCEEELYRLTQKYSSMYTTNTTIGAIITNASFSKAQMNKIASMASHAYARCICPVGTMADGDTLYACSTGHIQADINMVGTLASRAMGEAIKRALTQSQIDDDVFLSYCLTPHQ